MPIASEENAQLIKELADMDLHEIVVLNEGVHIMRVPGGWNYMYYDYQTEPQGAWVLAAIQFVDLPKGLMKGF
ncbi:hypothetical protein LCGC14_1410460 [marine sediment metagenome]|uniref:Uncharacterized protein n=1 Tax=marine sediment metagenome TaxID=412755 RepID=A0A0F9JUS3_9ZZZZ